MNFESKPLDYFDFWILSSCPCNIFYSNIRKWCLSVNNISYLNNVIIPNCIKSGYVFACLSSTKVEDNKDGGACCNIFTIGVCDQLVRFRQNSLCCTCFRQMKTCCDLLLLLICQDRKYGQKCKKYDNLSLARFKPLWYMLVTLSIVVENSECSLRNLKCWNQYFGNCARRGFKTFW
jgi:hypothetical protein